MSNHIATLPADLNYVEDTGPVTRVGVLLADEEAAVEVAEAHIGVSYAWTDEQEWGWEVCFNR